MPRGSGKRVSYLSTIILTNIMFLVMLAEFVPLSRKIPAIGYLFLGYTIALTTITILVLFLEKA